MNLKDLFAQFNLKSLKINFKILEMEFKTNKADEKAAWEMYIELLTRVSTQKLPEEDGDERTALNSLYSLFSITREIIKQNGKECINFAKIAIVVLNQIIRPFTAKWHRLSLKDCFNDKASCDEFRKELNKLQKEIRKYTLLLAELADVEKLTNLEIDNENEFE